MLYMYGHVSMYDVHVWSYEYVWLSMYMCGHVGM